jgi:FlaA1/EpsC-like NDP-sugar epimerase
MAYRFRSLFELEGHTVMPVQVYLWLLAIILPTWAFLLPIFGVYSEPGLRPLHQILRLSKAIGFAWLVMLAVQFFINQDQTNRLIVLFTLVINYLLLVSYRVILFKITKKGVLDVRHVAVVGVGPTAMQVARNIEDHRDWGLDLVGVFNQEEVRSILESGGIDELILLAERDSLNEFTQTFLMCEEQG